MSSPRDLSEDLISPRHSSSPYLSAEAVNSLLFGTSSPRGSLGGMMTPRSSTSSSSSSEHGMIQLLPPTTPQQSPPSSQEEEEENEETSCKELSSILSHILTNHQHHPNETIWKGLEGEEEWLKEATLNKNSMKNPLRARFVLFF